MPQVLSCSMLANPHDSFAIVVSRFNDLVTERLANGAAQTLERHGAQPDNITIAWIPGAFELSIVAEKMAASGKYAAVIALGAVIQGETDHHDYINHAVAQGLTAASQKTGVPILFGLLTCRNMEQALDRSGGKAGNKGNEAALAAIETVNLLKSI